MTNDDKVYGLPLLKRSKNARMAVVWLVVLAALGAVSALTWEWIWVFWVGLLGFVGGMAGIVGLFLVGGTTIFWVHYWVKTGELKAWHRFTPWGDLA